MYRDDSEAARARIEALEAELKMTRRRIAERERAIAEGCTSRVHLAAMKRVAGLEAKLARARATLKVPPWQAALERETDELRAELADLRELRRGDGAISAEIIGCRVEIEELRARAPALTIDGESWRPVELLVRMLWASLWIFVSDVGLGILPILEGGVPFDTAVRGFPYFPWFVLVAVLLAVVVLVIIRWSSCSLIVGANGIRRWDDPTFPANELRNVSFLASGYLHVRCGTTRFRFRASQPEFSAVARAVVAAAERLELTVRGQPPALLAAGENAEREP